jgi:hypothetical protein
MRQLAENFAQLAAVSLISISGEHCERIGINFERRDNGNVSDRLPARRALTRYRDADRMSSATISKINTLFAADFELLEYAKLRSW